MTADTIEPPSSPKSGSVRLQPADAAGVARIIIRHPGKLNALSVAMWRELRSIFDDLKAATPATATRALLLCGDAGNFAAGGDIGEFPAFRFDPERLRRFHEEAVAPALQALIDCDIPLVAQIDGACIGGGLEIAACCDLRICGRGSRFGIPIARLGFPLAPSEATIVGRVLGLPLLRELLLEARLFGADEALARGIVNRVVDDGAVAAEALAAATRMSALSPQAHRINKRTLRQLAECGPAGPSAAQRHAHFAYADSAEHREGLAAFVEKRPPRFQNPTMHKTNLFAALRAAFPADLDATAIETADGPGAPLYYSWRDLERGTAMLANLLQSLELPEGARVAVQTEKSVEALMLYLAVLRAGFVYLPLNTAYQAGEIEYFIGNAEPSVVVCSRKNFGWVSKIAFRAGTRNVFTLDDDRSGSLLERAVFHSDQHRPSTRGGQELAAILYTSGTTGRSKGAMLSHANLLSNARVLKDYWGWRGSDVLIHALPIFHVHGLFVASHGALLAGAKMIWFGKFDARAVIAQLPRATVFMGVPTLYVRMLAETGLGHQACANMRLFIAGSAPLLLETFNEWVHRTGHTILERYGMSETVMLSSNPYDPKQGERRGGTVGLALPGVGLRVHDDQGRPLPAGEIGNIEVRGPNVFAGYWRLPEKTAEEFTADGWFKTGDVGKVGADGYVSIVGRSKDLIISGGYNVYPAEIEAILNEMPGVAESAVIGVRHADFGEAVVAILVRKPGAAIDSAAISAELKAKIANFKVPKAVFVVDELPRNAMGKVQKNQLREQHKALFTG